MAWWPPFDRRNVVVAGAIPSPNAAEAPASGWPEAGQGPDPGPGCGVVAFRQGLHRPPQPLSKPLALTNHPTKPPGLGPSPGSRKPVPDDGHAGACGHAGWPDGDNAFGEPGGPSELSSFPHIASPSTSLVGGRPGGRGLRGPGPASGLRGGDRGRAASLGGCGDQTSRRLSGTKPGAMLRNPSTAGEQ